MNPIRKGRYVFRITGLIILISAILYVIDVMELQPERGKTFGDEKIETISPIRNINHPPDRARNLNREDFQILTRSIDGSGNNLDDPEMCAAFTHLLRLFEPDYSDGISALAGQDRPSPRVISNTLNAQNESIINTLSASDYLWQWGQFIDHDIDLTDGTDPPEQADIPCPLGDPFFDPVGTGTQLMRFNRSIYDKFTGTDVNNPREQLNEITGWIDASNVYGSDSERASALRNNDGTGKLNTSEGNLLPFNESGLPNAGGPADTLFIAGDVRSNEQVGLTVMHTLFMREHNRLAEIIAEEHPDWNGDQIYEKARQIVGALMQVITYNEFLPALLGPDAISPYEGYDPEVNAGVETMFSTAAFRFGHSALSPVILRLDEEGNEIDGGHLSLRSAFFSPQRIIEEGGIEPILRGLASQPCQRVDPFVIDDVRNFLFGVPGEGGIDLASLNLQRGRDHGLPSYNGARVGLGLGRADGFEDISSDPEIRSRLAEVYEDVDQIDMWAGGLSEDPLPNSHVGMLFYTIIKDQFEALRDGDRFWYELTLTQVEINEIENTKLSDIVRRNTNIGSEIQDDVFHIESAGTVEEGSGGGCSISNGGTKKSLLQYLLIPLLLFVAISLKKYRRKKK